MALVSPGVQISINDQSQYVSTAVGSIPLVVLATKQDKTYNGAVAPGTTAANAGQLLSFTSQRDLVTQMGTPYFQVSSSGTPVNGSEINEYGLMAAYSALGLSNQLYAIRADVDLNQLVGTSVRPHSNPVDGTYWLNTSSTSFGVFALNSTTSSFSAINPLLVTDKNQVENDTNFAYTVPKPLSSIGQIGQYAYVLVDVDGNFPDSVRLYYKASANSVGFGNQWVKVGSADWQKSIPVVTGTVTGPTLTAGSTLTINSMEVSLVGGTALSHLVDSINNTNIPGIKAAVSTNNQLLLFVTSAAKSDGSTVDGKAIVVDGANTPLATCGIDLTNPNFYCPYLFYGNYAQQPSGGWFTSDSQPRPSGSIWVKTTNTGGGFDANLRKYNASLQQFSSLTVPLYFDRASAIYGLDPVGGGSNIASGQVIAMYDPEDTTSNGLRFLVKGPGVVSGTGAPVVNDFTAGTSFTIGYSVPTTSALNYATVTLTGTTAASVVSDILNKNIPYVSASLNTTTNQITITHTSGGVITLVDLSGNPLTIAGFDSASASGVYYNNVTYTYYISGWTYITNSIIWADSTPYSSPVTGTYWYYSNPADVDILVNTGTAWTGYRLVSRDARGYNLNDTDSNGVIIAASTPVSQSDGMSDLVPGDLWLDSSDLENYPALHRYNGTSWVAIDNTDHVSSNGIIFADARWDSDGTTDPISDALPPISTLLTSPYVDLDVPDYRLYPRGTLLFNTRRSGYNVKKYVADYFNTTSFPNSSLPTVASTWVSASGLDTNGVVKAGSNAQRAIVVSAMQAAIDSNLSALEPTYQFNIICAPNYPELIPNLLTLNTNRGETSFVIGDTPMDLVPNATAINNWTNNVGGNGLPGDAATSPYLGLYYPAGLTNDLSGNQIVVPASHAVLRTFLYNDQVAYPWFAPAGVNRGRVSNLSDIGYINNSNGLFVHNGINEGLRDALFTLNINPITQLPTTGLVVFGQLTRSGSSTAQNRINVVRLENYLRTIFSSISNAYLFEPNDTTTRKSIASQIESALNNVLGLRGIYDYLVICDTTNNTPSTIANNQLYVDVAIEPSRDVEFIYIPIAIYNPGEIAALKTSST